MTESRDTEHRRDDAGARPLVERAIARARLALMWEGAWPWLAAGSIVVALFLAVSWFGLWDALPPWGRIVGVALFLFALLTALAPLIRSVVPDRRAALGRVDRATGVAHRPATSLDDELASVAGEDPMTRALWAAHRDRMRREAGRLKVGAPAPRLAARDPYALRFLVGLVLVAAFAVAGSDRGARVAAAFDWTSPAADVPPARLDAWVAPPGYTGRPPVFLTARAAGAGEPRPEERAAALPAEPGSDVVSVPANATLVIRGSGGAVAVEAKGGAEPVETPGRPPEGVVERRFKLTADAEARVMAAGAPDRVWRFTVIPDRTPSIELTRPPQMNARGTATLAYEVKDDYGVAGAEARFELKPQILPKTPRYARGYTPGEDAAGARRPLYEAPKVALGLPRARAKEGKAETPLDVMEHPFAGADAVMTLAARDEAGQEGLSKPHEIKLPARDFTKPLARALVEQRRTLALDANAKPRVLSALRALNLYPEQFTTDAAVYLGVTTAYRRLEIAKSDDELRAAADYLWEIALRIEDGDLPDAERELRAAEQKLREALERGASEEEIKKLTQDLRAALEKFMKEMAEQQRRDPNAQQQQQAQQGQRGKEIRPQDLRDMIDKMEKLAKDGAKDAAKQALADLKNMLDNLKNAQRSQPSPEQQAQQQQLNKLQEMIREQQKLRDQTFQQYRQNDRQQRNQRSQQNRRQQQNPEGEQAMKDLAQQQQRLREKLDQLRKEQGQSGEQEQGQEGQQAERQEGEQDGRQRRPGGEQGAGQEEQQGESDQPGQNALGQAGKSMGEAQGSLGQGQTGEALDQQQKALEQMRKGAQAMAEAMQQGQGQPGQQGQEGQQGAQNGEEGRDDDPLGRPVRRRESDGDTTKVPGEIDAQRARRVLEELRKRLGEADRPRDELDYIERLLAP
ncbi:TIGR02302 family protein [Chenggangzhangella methanolivorans]|uniref:TIGR02302 family protein n=1 Tax=Chenggangzhangella methanolivorans TaxID=1437009 RepID=UPI00360C2722